ncbi:MAG: cytochrome b N-terminal domain-containing protein [Pseudomonadota bacterium]
MARMISTQTQEDIKTSFSDLLLHVHPRRLPAQALALTRTWGLGGMAALLLMLQFLSGLLLLFVYQPSPVTAYDSILALQQRVLFGGFVRNIHHWSANVLVMIAFFHMLRVFYTGAFHAHRRFNWVIGLCLMTLVLGANFTGYLLPWDQLAYWAVTICTGMMDYVPGAGHYLQQMLRGGTEVGQATLSNFFVIHVMVLPTAFLMLLPVHFWRIRKAGGVTLGHSADQGAPAPHKWAPVFPELVLREVVAGLVLTAAIFILSALFDAPLHARANPGLSPNPTKPPWYFAAFQELLIHVHPVVVILVIPAICIAGLVALPYLRYEADTAGIWFCSATGRKTAWLAVGLSSIFVPVTVFLDEHMLTSVHTSQAMTNPIYRGIIPLIVIFGMLFGLIVWLRKRCHASRNEVMQSVFTLFLTTIMLLTLVGALFRGPDMKLGWWWG